MTDLLTRLTEAKEGSRELDAEIWFLRAATSDCPIEQGFENCGGVRLRWWRKGSVGLWDNELPHYTTSLDAITGLIERELPHAMWTMDALGNGMIWVPNKDDDEGEWYEPERDKRYPPALALCIAFVKAKEAGENEKP